MSVNEVKWKPITTANNKPALEMKGDGNNPHSKTFCIANEDHTLGNALRHVLLDSDSGRVQFAGYSVPHPSEPIVQIRVQTTNPSTNDAEKETTSSSTSTASDALKCSCQTLIEQCDVVLEQLEEKLPYVRDDRIQMENLLLEEGYDDEEEQQQQEADDDDYMQE